MLWGLIAFSLAWVGFAYLGYPLGLLLLERLSPRPARKGDVSPDLSVIIAVHNGEAVLPRKLESTLELEYPGHFEVIVASDASTDGTDAIAESMADRGVRLVRSPERLGEEAAQAAAIEQATGEVLVFTDLASQLERDALRQIVRPLADPTIGAVSSEDVVDSRGGEGAYVRFEMALRRLESEASTLVGLSGSCFAVRRSLCAPWPSELASDFRMALESARRGMRAVSEPNARVRFSVAEAPSQEWYRKVRTVRRGIAVLAAYRDLLHPRHGRVAFSLWGHKLVRFTSPFALVVLLLASAAAAPGSSVAAALLALQILAYGLGALALGQPRVARWFVARLAGFFVLVNSSMLVAWAYHLSGRRAVTWQPTRR
jgi:cellulose synthase/poly-beta-1,6-N-acetylglucosamine synthase-like glycosyltransferase